MVILKDSKTVGRTDDHRDIVRPRAVVRVGPTVVAAQVKAIVPGGDVPIVRCSHDRAPTGLPCPPVTSIVLSILLERILGIGPIMRKPQRMPHLMADCQGSLLGHNIENVARGVGRTGLVVAPTETTDVCDPARARTRKVVACHHHTNPPTVVVSSRIDQSRLAGILGRHVDIKRRKVR